MTARLILSDHDGEPITLVGSNNGIVRQVARQRTIRRWYYKHPKFSFVYAPLLYVEVEYKQTRMLLDTRHICIRFFAPQNDAERDAVAEAEAIVAFAKTHKEDPHTTGRMAHADEMMWLAVTGYFVNVPDKPKVTMGLMFRGTATWNEHEPIDPRLI